MGDMTLHTAATCSSNIEWSVIIAGGANTYTVRYGATFDSDYAYDWSCSCPEFTARRKLARSMRGCSHIERVRASKLRCGWNAELDPGAPADYDPFTGRHSCPECGGEVNHLRVMV